jgi:anti-sigma regulatory factor (Ser/Thr protein kinase)
MEPFGASLPDLKQSQTGLSRPKSVRALGVSHPQWAVPVKEASQVAEACRRAAALAKAARFDHERAGALDLVVTEAGTNLVRHAGGGEILLRRLDGAGAAGVEVLAIDRGDGIQGLAPFLADRHSTSGSAVTGLGVIRRLSDEFDVHSQPGRGTAIVSRLCAPGSPRPPALPASRLAMGVVCLPPAGDERPGDDWAWLPLAGGARMLVVDGQGHGDSAAVATAAAVATMRNHPSMPLVNLIESVHEALRATRGAVAAIADVQPGAGTIRYAGIGNISASVWGGGRRGQRLVSMNGRLGHSIVTACEFSYVWNTDSLLVLHSDGLHTRWDFDDYPGLVARHPSLIAGVLYRDFARGRDDVTVLVARAASQAGA